ncbi:MAG: hypothetical protein LUO93_08685 [Methanomicrobiales archaeon]|nr:hypothetical protein [Methanomicrobiales archaeon]
MGIWRKYTVDEILEQVKEMKVRVVMYNLGRFTKKGLCFVLIKEFYIDLSDGIKREGNNEDN